MKKIIFLILATLLSINCLKSRPYIDEIGNIILSVYIDKEKTPIPQNAYRILQNKMNQIVSKNGIGCSENQRFIITANVNELTRDITATAPPMLAITLEVTFYIGDGTDGTLFASQSITGKGVGETEDKAYINALKSIRTLDAEFNSFIIKGKTKIIEYYNYNIDQIMAEAIAMKDAGNFDEAISLLMSVPNVSDVYIRAMNLCTTLYKERAENEAARLLNKAKTIWSRGMDLQSAKEAAAVLADIDPNSSFFNESEQLRLQIEDRIKELDQREWEMLQKEKEQEWEMQQKKLEMQQKEDERNYQLEMYYIDACKEIAVAEAKNQPDIVYEFLWW